MLSVLIEGGEDAAALAASLAALVPGAVDGLVREVIVIDLGMGDEARAVVDHAGCRVGGRSKLRELIGSAKGDWLLCLEAGARLAPGWIEVAARHLAEVADGRSTPAAARFCLARRNRPPLLTRVLSRRPVLRDGLLLPKALARPEAVELADLAKGLATRRLDAEIVAAGPTKRP